MDEQKPINQTPSPEQTEGIQQTPTTTSPSPSPNPVPTEVKPKKRGKLVLFIVLGVILCAVTVVALWFFNRDKTLAPADSQNATETEQTETVSESGITYREYPLGEGVQAGAVVYYEPTKRYITLPLLKDQSYSAEVVQKDAQTQTTVDQVHLDQEKKLLADGFEPYNQSDENIALMNASLGLTSWYEKGDVLCELTTYGDQASAYSVTRTCSDTAETARYAAELEPLFVAYENSNDYQQRQSNEPYRLVMFTENTKDSEFTGYQYLYGGIGGFESSAGAAVAFVRQSDGEWVFFAGRQATMPCESYNTELFQKAFAHEECFANSSNGNTVKEYYKL